MSACKEFGCCSTCGIRESLSYFHFLGHRVNVCAMLIVPVSAIDFYFAGPTEITDLVFFRVCTILCTATCVIAILPARCVLGLYQLTYVLRSDVVAGMFLESSCVYGLGSLPAVSISALDARVVLKSVLLCRLCGLVSIIVVCLGCIWFEP